MKEDITPILVVVANGRYDCYGLKTDATPRDHLLMERLAGMGGVNESTEEGEYYFNIRTKEGREVASLVKIPEV